MIVRYTPDLFPVVRSLARRLHDEGSRKGNSWNEKKLEATLASPQVFCALVKEIAEYETTVYYGGVIGMVAEQVFGDDLIAFDLGLFVLPEKRGTSAAPRLIQAFEHWAAEQGAKEVHMGQTTGVEMDRTRRLYESMGYEVTGFNSKKEIGNVRG